MNPAAPPPPSPEPLTPPERARGRRLAWLSHPAGMTFRWAFTRDLPTLALLTLGAGEALVGLLVSVTAIAQAVSLPTLRAVGRHRKRSILVFGQCLALLCCLPLLGFSGLLAAEPPWGLAGALLSFGLVSVGLQIGSTVWFPLLRGYVEPGRIGRFFGVLRLGWHLTLIAFFLGAQVWLQRNPGGFGVLFGIAALCGLIRLALIARLPEASGERGTVVRIREALELLRRDRALRSYLLGVALVGGALRVATPFLYVWMRRYVNLSDGDTLWAAVAALSGAAVSLYPWGRVTDALGTRAVFRLTAAAQAAVLLFLWGTLSPDVSLATLVGCFFALAAAQAGFQVADTAQLFRLTPAATPSRHLVVAAVTASAFYGVAPLLAGVGLDLALTHDLAPVTAYRWLLGSLAAVSLLGLLPLASRSLAPDRA